MKTVVFAGPSIPVRDARTVLDAIYLPPVKQGDLVSAISTHDPDVIGILDGEFCQTLSVWHKEILYALSRGIHVYGASSMGALRAAETDMYGTVGVGEIYRMYADGTLTDDDEVALTHGAAESDYRPVSDPLVNIRITLAKAVDSNVIDEALAARLVALEKAVFFPERSYHHMFEAAAVAGEDSLVMERLRAFVRSSRVDQKRLDAVAMLTMIAQLPADLPPHVPSFAFEWTGNFGALYEQDRKVPVDGTTTELPLAAIAMHAALHAPDFNELNGHALDRALVQVLAEVLGVDGTAEETAAEQRRFCVERNLDSEAALLDWRQRNHLSASEMDTLFTQMGRRRALHRWLTRRRSYVGTTRFILNELRLRGDYEEWVRRADAHERLLGDGSIDDALGMTAEEVEDNRLSDLQLAIDHMRATECRMPIALGKWAEEAGILGARRLRVDLLRARAARRRAARLFALEDVGSA
ncbi:MAG: TfuA-like protein [bacterium]